MAQHSITRRIATLAIALAATAGIGTAVATTGHAAPAAVAVAAVETAETTYDFATRIVNEGEQAAIDACEGGLTLMNSVSDYLGRDYYPIHNECGGAPLLDLMVGHTVYIEGLGEYVVAETQDVMRGDSAAIIAALEGEILLQTCHNSGEGMRVLGLVAAA